MTAVETVQRFEYEQALDISRVKWLATEGWRVHTAVPCGSNIVYLMERPMAAGAVVDRLRDAEAERDRLVQALAEEQRQSAYYRDKADGLAEQVRQVSLVHCWTNEDGKRFLFADDVLAALRSEVR